MGWPLVLGLFSIVSTTAPTPAPRSTAAPAPAASGSAAVPRPNGVAPPPVPGVTPPGGPSATPRPGPASVPGTSPAMRVVRPRVPHPVRPAPAPEPEPQGPAPSLKLTVVTPAHGLWQMHVENLDTVPVRLVADARLLSLDVTPAGDAAGGHTVHCVLPGDMRPADDEERGLVVPPKRSYAESFDPRLYCFALPETAVLTPGASVVAHLGWAPPPARARHDRHPALKAGPYVVSPLEGVVPVVGAQRELTSEAFSIPAEVAVADPAVRPTDPSKPPASPSAQPPSSADPPPPAVGDAPPRLSLEVSSRADVERPGDLTVAVRLSNDGNRPVSLLFRPTVLHFVAAGPAGATRCRWPNQSDTPIRELFTTLSPHESTSVEVQLADLCQIPIFDKPGLYVVRARLDTRRASGASIGMRTFDGELEAKEPMLVRVRAAKDGIARPRPTLE